MARPGDSRLQRLRSVRGRVDVGDTVNFGAAVRLLFHRVMRKRQHRIVILGEPPPPSPHPPIFIIGCPRSGTSLLRRVLDSHSRIACPPESHFLLPLLATLSDRHSMLGLESMGFSRRAVVARARAFAERFFLEYATANGKIRWADKTPLYVDCLDAIDEVFDGTARYVMLYRHGLDVAFSMVATFGDGITQLAPPIRGDHPLIRSAASYWADRVAVMQEFERRHPERTLAVRYEQLTAHPEATLRPVFSFLGEPFEERTLAYNAHHHDEGLEDGKIALGNEFRPVMGAYRRWRADELAAALDEAGPALSRLGYEV